MKQPRDSKPNHSVVLNLSKLQAHNVDPVHLTLVRCSCMGKREHKHRGALTVLRSISHNERSHPNPDPNPD